MIATNDERFRRELVAIFSKVPGLDDTPVGHYQCDRCEDGRTTLILITLADNRELAISLCDGEPISIRELP